MWDTHGFGYSCLHCASLYMVGEKCPNPKCPGKIKVAKIVADEGRIPK